MGIITTTLVNTSTKLTSMKAVTVALVLTLALASNAFTLDEKVAKSALNSRARRANGGVEEQGKGSNVERECVEETCNWEEYLEIAENSDSQVRNSVVQQSRSSQSGESRLQTLFNTLYLDCHTKVVAAGLDDERAIDFRPHCYHTFFQPAVDEMNNEFASDYGY